MSYAKDLPQFDQGAWSVKAGVIKNSSTNESYNLQVEAPDLTSEFEPGLRALLDKVDTFYKAELQDDGTIRVFSSASDKEPKIYKFRERAVTATATKIMTITKAQVEEAPVPLAQSPALTAVFPNTLAKIKFFAKLGGKTSDARKVVDEDSGNAFALKSVSKTGGVPHLLSEHRANKAYKVLGVPAADTEIYANATFSDGELHGVPNGTKMLSRFIEGRVLGDYINDPSIPQEKKKEVVDQARKHFMVDVLFANWDVAGPKLDNMIVGSDGIVYRIDNGGAFGFTGYGRTESKGWDGELGELHYFTSPHYYGDKTVNQLYTGVGPFEKFGPITKEEIITQMEDLLSFFENQDNSIRFFTIFEDAPTDKAYLQARLDHIRDVDLPALKSK
jgi:hypothetical protein